VIDHIYRVPNHKIATKPAHSPTITFANTKSRSIKYVAYIRNTAAFDSNATAIKFWRQKEE